VTGIVFIRVGGVSFPGDHWSDFPIVILGWWLEPVSRILHGKTHLWECRFMDGPYMARLEKHSEDVWNFTGLRDGRTEYTERIACRSFIQSLLEAARQILDACKKRGWQDRDIDVLESAVRTIEHAIA